MAFASTEQKSLSAFAFLYLTPGLVPFPELKRPCLYLSNEGHSSFCAISWVYPTSNSGWQVEALLKIGLIVY